jgi:hypothetical protein
MFALCSLGCGWLCCAVLRLEPERWYIGTAVPEGGLRSASRPCIVWASSLLERPVFAPPIALMAFSLWLGWMLWAWPSLCSCELYPGCISFSPVFINKLGNSLLLN